MKNHKQYYRQQAYIWAINNPSGNIFQHHVQQIYRLAFLETSNYKEKIYIVHINSCATFTNAVC